MYHASTSPHNTSFHITSHYPTQEAGYDSASSLSSSGTGPRAAKKHRRHGSFSSQHLFSPSSSLALATEHRQRAAYEQKISEYILQESYDAKEIREGDEYQVNVANIPVAQPFNVASHSVHKEDTPSLLTTLSPTEEGEYADFFNWGTKQLLQPGMVTLAFVPSAKVGLATPLASANVPVGKQHQHQQNQQMEPVLHHVQRYCVVVTQMFSPTSTSPSEGADRLLVFDGISHHVVTTNLCSLINPPLMAKPAPVSSNTATASSSERRPTPANEMRMINLVEIWSESKKPREVVSLLCKVSKHVGNY